MIEGKGKFLNRKTKTANRDYDKFFIYVPAEVARDGTFPFKAGDEVTIRIEQETNSLTIEKTGKERVTVQYYR